MQESPLHKRVPRPIICQNFALERTFLKNTRFTHSGTSMLWHLHGSISDIHPLDCQFQLFAATYSTHGRRSDENPLCFYTGRGNHGICGLSAEERKVCHYITPIMFYLVLIENLLSYSQYPSQYVLYYSDLVIFQTFPL